VILQSRNPAILSGKDWNITRKFYSR
jgi:hypothetical protein